MLITTPRIAAQRSAGACSRAWRAAVASHSARHDCCPGRRSSHSRPPSVSAPPTHHPHSQHDLSIVLDQYMLRCPTPSLGWDSVVLGMHRMWEVCGRMMVEGRGAWSAISASRWNYSAYFHPDHARHGTVRRLTSSPANYLYQSCFQINVHAGRFLTEDMSLFDAPFFKLTGNAVTDGTSAVNYICP